MEFQKLKEETDEKSHYQVVFAGVCALIPGRIGGCTAEKAITRYQKESYYD